MSEVAPQVSVVMPVRDEAQWIERAIRSVLLQELPDGTLEVLVVDGGSRDGTADLLAKLAASDPRIRVLENPQGDTPGSLNIAIAAARGEFVARVDGHGWLETGYLRAGLKAMNEGSWEAVGGVVRFVGEGFAGKAISVAMTSRLGAGTAAFRTATVETAADGIMWGIWRRELFDRIGAFDTNLLRNQDDELCHRIRLAGGHILVTPAMRFNHVSRDSFGALWRQYRAWGEFRVATMVKHRSAATPRQLVAPGLVAALMLAGTAECSTGGRIRTGRGAASVYVLALAAGAMLEAERVKDRRLAAPLAAAFATMHLGYGVGFWRAAAGRALSALRSVATT